MKQIPKYEVVVSNKEAKEWLAKNYLLHDKSGWGPGQLENWIADASMATFFTVGDGFAIRGYPVIAAPAGNTLEELRRIIMKYRKCSSNPARLV